MNANWRSNRAPNVVFINTDLHRATLLDEDVAFPLDNPGAWMAKHEVSQEDVDNVTRAIFWRSYTAAVALTLVCVVILANWPN